MSSLARTPCDEGVIRAATPPEAAGCPDRDKPWVLAATILGSSIAFIDGSVVSVALPVMQAELATTVRGAQWIVNAYMLLLGALILVGGGTGDRFGRRRVFTVGLAVFAAASVGCGLAPDVATLIVMRAAQGVGGALLVPSSLAIVSAAFPEGERGRAIGTWAGFSALTTALGPVLGGWLVDAWSWRAIFFINVPLAALAVSIARARVPESRAPGAGPVDWRGGLLATLGLAGLAYGLTAASERGWTDPVVLAALAGGVLVLAGFVAHERRAPAPMMPVELFRSRTFSGANGMTLLLYFALSGALFFLPFNLIQVQGYSAALAGAALLPFTLIMGGLSRWSGGLIDRYGARTPLVAGSMIAAAGLALLAVPGIGGSYWTTFFPATAVLGFGMAVAVAPLTTAVMSAVDEVHAGVASGINNAVARVAGLLAVALLGAVAVGAFGAALDERAAALGVRAEHRQALAAQASRLAEAELPADAAGVERERLERAVDEAFVQSFRVVMLITAAAALGSAVCARVTVPPQAR
ncbi:MAG TPA: MFS transporter [Gammaproteobacteria bacterium]